MIKLAKTSLLAFTLISSSIVASDILASVNGVNITKQDAQAFVTASAPKAIFAQLQPSEQTMVLDRLIEKVLFTQLASDEGIDKKPEFKRNMDKIKDELLVNMWMKEQMDSAMVSDGEAKDFYEKNAEKFMGKASMHARHILVATEDEAKAIIEVLNPLEGEALKSKFIALAKAKSTGPSGPKGGDLGTFTKGQMVPEFSKAVWALEDAHATKESVKTQFGYHVIYLEKKTPAQVSPYEKEKEKIISLLKQQQFNSKIRQVAQELKSKAKIDNLLNKSDGK